MLGLVDEHGDEPQPQNVGVEQALLGALLVQNDALEGIEGLVSAADFYDPFNARIFEVIEQLISRGAPASPITIRDFIEEDPRAPEISLSKYLADLASSAVTVVNAPKYATVIRDYAHKRALFEIGGEIQRASITENAAETSSQQIENAEEALFKISGDQSRHGPRQISNVTADFLSDMDDIGSGQALGEPTGLIDVDKMLGGFFAPDLIILAGRPGMGKTALGVNITRHVAEHSGWVAFFSIEMAGRQIVERLIADGSSVPVDAMRRGTVQADMISGIQEEALRVAGLKIVIDDNARSVGEIRTRARRLHRRFGLKLIVIDYLQLMIGGEGENRVQEIAIITSALKAIAKDLMVPVLALSQLNRAVEGRNDKRPMLADLRDGGTIEQDADLVMFLYREAYYMERNEPTIHSSPNHQDWVADMEAIRNTAELIIAKNRFGPTGKVQLSFIPERTRFGNLVKYEEDVS